MLFDYIGIQGWDDIESMILSAVLSDLSILLIGDIGTNKTEGSKLIAKTILVSYQLSFTQNGQKILVTFKSYGKSKIGSMWISQFQVR